MLSIALSRPDLFLNVSHITLRDPFGRAHRITSIFMPYLEVDLNYINTFIIHLVIIVHLYTIIINVRHICAHHDITTG